MVWNPRLDADRYLIKLYIVEHSCIPSPQSLPEEMMSKVRGVRFTDKEEAQIEEFLNKNPLLDFSTMAKVAILTFIKNPTFSLTPIKPRPEIKENQDVRTISQ